MSRECVVCRHPLRLDIERALLGGETFRNIVEQFQVSLGGLHRHKSDHLLESVQRSHEASEVLRADALIDHVRQLRTRTETLYGEVEEILNHAKRARNLKVALEAIKAAGNVIREGRGNATLLGQLTGELQNANAQMQITIVLPQFSSEITGNAESTRGRCVDIAMPGTSQR